MKASARDIEHLEPDDDAPVGKVLSRREVLGILAGLAGAAVLAACECRCRARTQHSRRARWGQPRRLLLGRRAAGAATRTPLSQSRQRPSQPHRGASPTTTSQPRPIAWCGPRKRKGHTLWTRSSIAPISGRTLGRLAERGRGTPAGLSGVADRHQQVRSAPQRADRCVALRRDGRLLRHDRPKLEHRREEVPARLPANRPNGKAQFTTIYPGWYRGRTVPPSTYRNT